MPSNYYFFNLDQGMIVAKVKLKTAEYILISQDNTDRISTGSNFTISILSTQISC